MKIALIGSRWFGAEMFKILSGKGHDIHVIAPDAEDRLAQAATAAGAPLTIHANRYKISPDEMPEDIDVIVSAYSHAFIGADVTARAKRAAIGYHPSLLPRWRGIAAVEWTIEAKDPIAGGSVYHLTDEMDAGGIAAQDWCHVYPDDDARTLWQRDLAPMGLRLLGEVVDYIDEHGEARADPQDDKLVTLAPRIKK